MTAFRKWSTTNELRWATGNVLTAGDINNIIDEVIPPIGAIIAWAKDFDGVPQTLPYGWKECDGSAITDDESPFNGGTLPNLNLGPGKVLLGGSTSAVLANADHTHIYDPGQESQTVTGVRGPVPTYTVIWIMRIK